MRIAALLLTILCQLLLPATAELWRSNTYRCEFDAPTGAAWMRGNPLRLPVGEMIFLSEHVELKQGIVIICAPRFATADVQSPTAVSRILENIRALGYTTTSQEPTQWLDLPAMQITAERADANGGNRIAQARAVIRDGDLFILLHSVSGDSDVLQTKAFLAPFTTFRFLQDIELAPRAPDPLTPRYIQAYKAIAIALAALLVGFTLTLWMTRRNRYR